MLKENIAVIGSGMAGSFLAALLAQRGYRISLFEKQARTGGCADSFRRGDFLFPTSITSYNDQIYSPISLLPVSIEKVCEIQTHYFIAGKSFDDTISIKDNLMVLFPEDRNAIQGYYDELYEISNILDKVYAENMSLKSLSIAETSHFLKYAQKTATEVLHGYFESNPIITEIMCTVYDVDETASAVFIPVYEKSVKGCLDFIPVGGAKGLIEMMNKILLENGGVIHLSESVEKIEVFEGRITAFTTSKSVYDNFTRVIWCCDLESFYKLVSEKNLGSIKLDYRYSDSSYAMWVAIKKPLQDLGLPQPTVVIDVSKYDWTLKCIKRELALTKKILFISSGFSQDNLSTPKDKSQICNGLIVDYDFFAQYAGDPIVYYQIKEEIQKKILSILYDHFDIDREDILFCESATPLTYERYTGNAHGAMYGYKKEQTFIQSRNRHKNVNKNIKNVQFCSHWTSIAGGVYGALEEAVKVANMVIKEHEEKPYELNRYGGVVIL